MLHRALAQAGRQQAAALWACGSQGVAAGPQAAGGLLALRAPLPPAAGGTGARALSGTARETLSEAAHKVKSAASASADAVAAAGRAVSQAPGALYRVLPAPAKQLVDAAQTPGAVNRVLSLQLTALWQNYGNVVIAVGAAGTCYATWRALLGASQLFVDVGSDTMAVTGLLALSGVGAGALYLRRRYTIDPVAAYRLAMYRLNTHPGLLEVMGAPLVGSPVQASVLTGGSLHFRGLRPKLQSKRIQMIFPLKGAERRGLVSLEAKKRHGQLQIKLLAADVPSVAGGEQRIFLEGGPSVYERGGVLGVLRDPFIRALSMEEAFLAEDEAEDAAEERAAAKEAAARAAAAAARQPKPLDQGGGLYFYEKVLLGARGAWARWTRPPEPAAQQQPVASPGEAAAAGKAAVRGAARSA